MTMLEKILKDRAWRGSKVEEVELVPGRFVYRITHPSGATANVLKEPGDMDSRYWSTWARRQERERVKTRMEGWR
jgi:hypothetical protein